MLLDGVWQDFAVAVRSRKLVSSVRLKMLVWFQLCPIVTQGSPDHPKNPRSLSKYVPRSRQHASRTLQTAHYVYIYIYIVNRLIFFLAGMRSHELRKWGAFGGQKSEKRV